MTNSKNPTKPTSRAKLRAELRALNAKEDRIGYLNNKDFDRWQRITWLLASVAVR